MAELTNDTAIRINNLSKCYQIYDKPNDRLKQSIYPRFQRLVGKHPKQYFREFWALKDVSFEVKKGETVGIIGRNGSGKSTLLQLICGTLYPTTGSIQADGRIAALLELGSGFNPEFTGRENVYMNASILGITNEEIESRYDDIVAFADIGEFIEQPVKTYSSGMFVRLAFAVAANVDPDILIIDEALAVGDMSFQKKCMERIDELRNAGRTMLFCSHDMHAVSSLCDHVAWMKDGMMMEIGASDAVISSYISWVSTPSRPADSQSADSAPHNPNYFVRNSDEVQIMSVKLFATNGAEKDIFCSGDDLLFEVVYNAPNGIKEPNYSVIIFRNDKIPVAIGKSCYEKHIRQTGMVQGINKLKVTLKSLQLNNGKYSFGISIWDKGNKISFANNITREFEIKSLKIVFGPTEEKCVYFPEIVWEY